MFVLTANETPSAISVEINLSTTDGFGVSAGTRTVEFAGGETTATLTVGTSGNEVVEEWGTVTATIECGTGYLIGATSTASVVIADDDVKVSIAAQAWSVAVDSAAVFILTANKAPSTAFTVGVAVNMTGAFEVGGGTRTVEFEAGARTATLSVELQGDDGNDDGVVDDDDNDDGVVDDGANDDGGIGDGISDPSDTVTATLRAGFGYMVGTPSRAVVTIVDDNQE